MKSNPLVRRVNVGRLGPVVDTFRSGDAAGPDADPSACPACPACGGETLWFVEPHTNSAELVCLDCVPDRPANDLPEAGGPKGSAPTAEHLKRHARAYADGHFPGWRGVTIHIWMSERGDGGCGELLLVLTNSAVSRPHRPAATGNDLSAQPLLNGVQAEPVADGPAPRPRA